MKCVRAYLRDSFFFCVVTVAIGDWSCGAVVMMTTMVSALNHVQSYWCLIFQCRYFVTWNFHHIGRIDHGSCIPNWHHFMWFTTKKLRICKTNHVNKSQKIDFVRALFDQSVIWIWCHFTADLFLHQSAAINIGNF